MTTFQSPFERAPLPDDVTAALAIAMWKEAHETHLEPTLESPYSPGELHGMTPRLPGHLGAPMLRRARRRHRASGELNLA